MSDDPTTAQDGPSASGGPAAAGAGANGEPLGIREQVGATVAAVRRLVQAHLDLAKAELADILDEVKRVVGLIGAAIGLLLVAAFLFLVGFLLFLGEWLFGSIGWGVLLGTLLLVDVAAMLVLAALDVSGRRLGTAFGIAALLGILVGLVFGFDLTHRGWTALGDAAAGQYDPNTRAVLLAVGISASVLGVLGFLAGLRGGFGAALGGLVAWAIGGALIGLLTVASLPPTVGAALGVLAWLVAWPLLAGRDVMRTGIDGEAMAKKFTPEATMELTKETIEWVRERTPLVPKS